MAEPVLDSAETDRKCSANTNRGEECHKPLNHKLQLEFLEIKFVFFASLVVSYSSKLTQSTAVFLNSNTAHFVSLPVLLQP